MSLIEGTRVSRLTVNGDEHFKDQVEFVRFADGGLEVDGGFFRIDAGCEIIKHQAARVFDNVLNRVAVRLGGQHVEIGDNEGGVVGMLQRDSRLERTDIVAKMQASGRSVAGEDAFLFVFLLWFFSIVHTLPFWVLGLLRRVLPEPSDQLYIL